MFDYSKVRGKIREKFNTQDEFASAMGFSKTTLSYKLNNKVEWTQKEIEKAAELLEIEKAEIPLYFFNAIVQEPEQ